MTKITIGTNVNSSSLKLTEQKGDVVLARGAFNSVAPSSYDRAVAAGYIGTEGEFYQNLAGQAVSAFPVQDLPPLP